MNTETLEVKVGAEVAADGLRYRIRQLLDLDTILVVDVATGEPRRINIRCLKPAGSEAPPAKADQDLAAIPDEDWRVAQERFQAIRPLIETPWRTKQLVRQRATEVDVDVATLYRWIRQYEVAGVVEGLVPSKPGVVRGTTRLAPDVESIVRLTIDDTYLTSQRRSVQATCNEVIRRCRNAKIEPPHPNTVRNRIARLADSVCVRRRRGAKAAADKYSPVRGEFPGADWPLAFVQLDHTKIDLILVDDVHRRPVGRPWITLAIDVFSRTVPGFYISFDPPGTISTALCLAHAVLPKETWLAKLGISTPWPVWGLMSTIHLDNAKEFHGNTLQMACQNYGIDINWRPVARPSYGGHIERLLGTFGAEVHSLPGTTFSNPQQRGDYDSVAKAAMTLSEFERWLTIYITEVYHQRVHSSLGTSPLKKYEEGIFGTATSPGRGLPRRVLNETHFRLDFMPYVERSIQKYGLMIDEIHYFDDVLTPWIDAKDPDEPKRKRSFIVRRDPRDISVVHFFDPELRQYFEIPYRDTARPPMSIWELREVRRRLEEEGRKNINEDLIFEAYGRMRAIEEAAVKETLGSRRREQRRRDHAVPGRSSAAAVVTPPSATGATGEDIKPFEDLDDLS